MANIILRILDFDEGQLLINGSPIQRYDPFEFHTHVTAVFQSFSKHNGTARENIGVGYVGDMDSSTAVQDAVGLARANHIIDSLPDGLNTKLDTSGFYNSSFLPSTMVGSGAGERPSYVHHGMSGGEVRNNLCLVDSSTDLLGTVATYSYFACIYACSQTRSQFAAFRRAS